MHQTWRYLPFQRNPESWGRRLSPLSIAQGELGVSAIQNTTTWGDISEAKKCLYLLSESDKTHGQNLAIVSLVILQDSVSLNSLQWISLVRISDFLGEELRMACHFLLKRGYWKAYYICLYTPMHRQTGFNLLSAFSWNNAAMAKRRDWFQFPSTPDLVKTCSLISFFQELSC